MESNDPAPAGQARNRVLRAKSRSLRRPVSDRPSIERAAGLYRDALAVAVLHPGEQSRALSRRLRFMALHLMVEARGGEPTP